MAGGDQQNVATKLGIANKICQSLKIRESPLKA